MGQFSWLSNNGEEQIYEKWSRDQMGYPNQQVIMLDNKGNIFSEKNYEGYGVFGGKDFYSLLDEMNGGAGDRSKGIDLAFSNKKYLSPQLYVLADGEKAEDYKWEDKAPEGDPNQGWIQEEEEEEWCGIEEYMPEEEEEY